MSESGQGDRSPISDVPAAAPGRTLNTGVSISGHTVSGVNVGGHGNQFTVVHGAPADDRLKQIERLLRELQAAAGNLDGEQPEQIRDDAGRLLSEATQRKPDRERITQLLTRIAEAATPFASLVGIVTQLKGLF